MIHHPKFFPLLMVLNVGRFNSVFKDKKLLRSHKTVEIKVFLNIFGCWLKDPKPYKYLVYSDPGGAEI